MSKPDADTMAFVPWLRAVRESSVLIDATQLRRHLYRWCVESGVLPREPMGATNNTQLNRLARAWDDKGKRDAIVAEARRWFVERRRRARQGQSDSIITN